MMSGKQKLDLLDEASYFTPRVGFGEAPGEQDTCKRACAVGVAAWGAAASILPS